MLSSGSREVADRWSLANQCCDNGKEGRRHAGMRYDGLAAPTPITTYVRIGLTLVTSSKGLDESRNSSIPELEFA